jgi:ferric-dicitrate binding protein FerR (iron transport regulator)
MNNSKHDDNFLAHWAVGNVTEEANTDFEKTKEYQAYKAILNGTDLLDVPKFNNEALFEKIQQHKNSKPKGKVVRLLPKWAYVAAASVVLLFSYLFLFDNTVSYAAGFGEQLSITLPDNSEVILNAKSILSYNKKEWKSKRNLNLEGEAYFKVSKGETFSVSTNNGMVEVLGTQFTVNTDDIIFEVICYEGKVKVTSNSVSKVLTQGNAVRLVNAQFEDWELNTKEPSWIQQKSTFKNTPLPQVIKALEKQYDITIDTSKIAIDKLRYTGGFVHNNLDKALKTVFEPLKIKFTFTDKNTIVLTKK